MSVYIFGNGKSVYGDAVGATEHILSVNSTSPQLSTIILKESTTASEIVEYSKRLRTELEEIRKKFFNDPKPEHIKDYNKFLLVQQELMNHCDDLIELYQKIENASQLTPNRRPALRQKIMKVGLKISSLISSYNTSGIFVGRDLFVSVPTPNSYEEILRVRLLKALE